MEGGYKEFTCTDYYNETSNDTDVFGCKDFISVPDCVDRAVYCTFPPEDFNGVDEILENLSPLHMNDLLPEGTAVLIIKEAAQS